jgi:hypothetical protein
MSETVLATLTVDAIGRRAWLLADGSTVPVVRLCAERLRADVVLRRRASGEEVFRWRCACVQHPRHGSDGVELRWEWTTGAEAGVTEVGCVATCEGYERGDRLVVERGGER